MNLDGFLDIVICNFQHNYRTDQPAYIYWGGPDGFHFTNRTDLPAYLANGLAVGDLNKDGLPDVVLQIGVVNAVRALDFGNTWNLIYTGAI